MLLLLPTLTPISWPRIIVVTRTSSPEPVPARVASVNVSRYMTVIVLPHRHQKIHAREQLFILVKPKDVICIHFGKASESAVFFPVGPMLIHNNIITFLSDNLWGSDNSAWKGICCLL